MTMKNDNKAAWGWFAIRSAFIGIGLSCVALDVMLSMYGWAAAMLAGVILSILTMRAP